jgi:acetyl esterase/lipase
MPTSREGHAYARYLFKPVAGAATGGCHADVFLPKHTGGKMPVAVTYHGGGFVICNAQHILCGHVGYLLARGFAVVGLEYRMAPQ